MRVNVARLWTSGRDQAEPGPWALEIDGERITAIRQAPELAHDEVLPMVAMPGLIDCHEHIGIDVGDERAQGFEPLGRMLMRGVRNLSQMIAGGVTTIRDCGERPDAEATWIGALDEGIIEGPRVIRSISPIARTGGHAWYISRQTDGVENVRSRVREHRRDGADFIKVMATGGVGTAGADQKAADYTAEELTAVIDEAHRLGMRVAAHAHGGTGATNAILAGADTIEHGALLDDEQLALMAERGTVLVVTQGVFDAYIDAPDVAASTRAFMPSFAARGREMLQRARAHGVTIALGSDCVHGGIAGEMKVLVEEGFTPRQALEAATASGAAAIGRPELGRLEEGSVADIILLDDDPTADIDSVARVRGVIIAGKWVRELHPRLPDTTGTSSPEPVSSTQSGEVKS